MIPIRPQLMMPGLAAVIAGLGTRDVHPGTLSRRLRGAALGATVVGLACLGAGAASAQLIDKSVTGRSYHYQVTDHYCASATVQMILDCTAVRTTNPYINTFLMAADPPSIPTAPGHFCIPLQPTYAGGQVTFAPQVAIYNLIHNAATYVPIAGPFTGIPLTYNNPWTPWPVTGSGNNAIQWALNVLDNPTVGGNGNHAYTAFNVPPTAAWATFASRTIANAITSFDVPAQVTVGSGAHSIAVTGVTSIGVPVNNTNYTITGFYVSDPWTGYWVSRGRPAGVPPGLGIHQWIRYGYMINPVATPILIPGVGMVTAKLGKWFTHFNPAPGFPGEGAYMSGPGYKFVVEPLGPEPIDDGNGGLYSSLPPPSPMLPGPISTAADALSYATSGLAAAGFLNDESGLQGGSFDLSGIAYLPAPDGFGGDWVVPYDQAGGDASGAVLVNSLTGEIDAAMWTEDTAHHLSDAEVGTMFSMLNDGNYPDDNPVNDEPTATLVARFDAAESPDGVDLVWSSSAVDVIRSWNIYRGSTEDGEFARLNAADIPMGGGGEFRFTDDSGVAGAAWYRLTAVMNDGTEQVMQTLRYSATGVTRALQFRIAGTNPFRDGTTLQYALPDRLPVRIEVFTVSGRRVATLVDGTEEAGVHTVRFDLRTGDRSLGAGLYLVHLRAGDQTRTLRVIALQ